MTQHLWLYLLKLLLYFLFFEPIVCPPNEPQFIRRQDRASYIDTSQFYNTHFAEALANRRNFEYQQYEPQPLPQPYPRYDDILPHANVRPHRPSTSSFSNFQHDIDKDFSEPMNLDEKIRRIFHINSEEGTHLFNKTVDTNLSSIERMHSDESFDHRKIDNGSTTLLTESSLVLPLPSSTSSSLVSSLASLPISTTTLTSVELPKVSMPEPILSSTMNISKPTFKVQRTPDGKLSLVFNDLSLQKINAEHSKKTTLPRRPEIIFPDQHVTSKIGFRDCDSYEGESLCKRVRNYPKLEQLDDALRREFTRMGLFFVEDLELPRNITQRFGGDDDNEIDPCDTYESVIYPEAGETRNSGWMLILNNNMTYRQGVLVEKCHNENQPCKVINPTLPNDYQSVCRQHYNYRKLIGIRENGTFTTEHFKIPSCCKCMLRRVNRY